MIISPLITCAPRAAVRMIVRLGVPHMAMANLCMETRIIIVITVDMVFPRHVGVDVVLMMTRGFPALVGVVGKMMVVHVGLHNREVIFIVVSISVVVNLVPEYVDKINVDLI